VWWPKVPGSNLLDMADMLPLVTGWKGVDCINLDKVRKKWQAIVDTAINYRSL
jgi:hypothetical protein